VRRLEGRLAIVTGASSGIGAATARRLDAEGAKLMLCGRSSERLEALRAELSGDALVAPGDLTDEGEADRIVALARQHGERIDALVNNAAMDHAKSLLETPVDDVRALFAINFFAAARLLQACAGSMRDTGGGAIVNVTSRLAAIGVPTMTFYGASKGALAAFTRGAAVELAPFGIRVNAVAPGMTRTPLFDEWLAGLDDPAGAEAEVTSKIPLGTLATPEDVAAAIAYLVSDDATQVTGATLPVDGGYTAA
jgi:NAD(P)-dependent dehydrogenase (short-subunit alcohol dehydrogenase family)